MGELRGHFFASQVMVLPKGQGPKHTLNDLMRQIEGLKLLSEALKM